MKIKQMLKNIYCKLPHVFVYKQDAINNRRYKICNKIMNEYSKYVDTTIKSQNKNFDYVWTCWLQGTDNAPAIVKTCIKSMEKHFPDKKLVVITNENLKDYAEIPQYVLDKWKKGIITNTHFSDILRAELLSKWGGLWVDATVLCTGNLDKYIDESSEIFVFKNEHRGSPTECLSSWLIYSKPNNPFMVNTRNMLYKYWEKKNKLADYFLFHVMFTAVSKVLAKEWSEIPFYTNLDPHILQFYELLKPYNQERFDKVKEMTNFHKLSYKIDKNLIKEDSLFAHLERGDYK